MKYCIGYNVENPQNKTIEDNLLIQAIFMNLKIIIFFFFFYLFITWFCAPHINH